MSFMSFFHSTNNKSNKKELDILDITDNLFNVKQSGDNFRAQCPICGSNSARPFILFPNGGYYCHSCNEKGSLYKLTRDVLNLDFASFRQGLKSFKPFKRFRRRNVIPDFFNTFIKQYRGKHIRTNRKRAFELLYDLIPENARNITHRKNNDNIGYDDVNDTLVIAIIDEKSRVRNLKKRQIGNIKWLGMKGGDGRYAPHRLTGKKFVYIASGLAEFMILNASELDYIVMQSDGADINQLIPHNATAVILEDNDKRDIVNQEDRKYQCYKNPNQYNPFKKKVTDKIYGDKIAISFEKILNRELKAGYDLRDFVKDEPEYWLELIEVEVEKQLMEKRMQLMMMGEEFSQSRVAAQEIIMTYYDRYPDYTKIKDMIRGVVIAPPHSGKTFLFQDRPYVLIIVPRVEQCTVFEGESTEKLLNKISKHGAIITYQKFCGHYRYNDEFRKMIDNKKIKLIVDEAHELLTSPSKDFQLIYNLDAIFMSATLEKFFRRDLQRYKYKPAQPDIIYYTKNGELPQGYRPIIFADNAKALKANYPRNSVVSRRHKDFKSVNIHKTDHNMVFVTSALREGVSIKNKNFNASMVYSKECRLWSMKQKIQALYRLRRDDAIKIISAPPKEQYTKYIDYDWWKNFIKNNTKEQIANTVMGEHYSKMMEITHKVNNYEKIDEYSIICYLGYLTRNNYDKDFFRFVEYEDNFVPIEINTKIEKYKPQKEDKEYFYHYFEEKEQWAIPKKKRKAFESWLQHYNSGFVGKLEKLNKFKNLNEIYLKSNLAKTVKAQYNKMYKRRGKRYNIGMFYKLLRGIAKIEIRDDKTGKIMQRLSSKTDLKHISIRVVDKCSIAGIKVTTLIEDWLYDLIKSDTTLIQEPQPEYAYI